MKAWGKYDDTLDVFGVHGVGGALGTLALAVFAHPMFGGNQVRRGCVCFGVCEGGGKGGG